MLEVQGNDLGNTNAAEFDPEEVIRELSEEEIIFMQMIGGAKGIGGGGGI
ncbi:hypothetical protein [Pseudomonas sp. EA_15y_Pfl2_R67]